MSLLVVNKLIYSHGRRHGDSVRVKRTLNFGAWVDIYMFTLTTSRIAQSCYSIIGDKCKKRRL